MLYKTLREIAGLQHFQFFSPLTCAIQKASLSHFCFFLIGCQKQTEGLEHLIEGHL